MTFTEIAKAYSQDRQGRIIEHCEAMEWQELTPAGLTLPMMPGEGIKAAIRELRLPRVSHVAYSHDMAPYGLYGAKCRYSNGPAEVYLLDIGIEILVLCHRLLEKEVTA